MNYILGNMNVYLQFMSFFHRNVMNIYDISNHSQCIFIKHEMHRTKFTYNRWFLLLHKKCCAHQYSEMGFFDEPNVIDDPAGGVMTWTEITAAIDVGGFLVSKPTKHGDIELR